MLRGMKRSELVVLALLACPLSGAPALGQTLGQTVGKRVAAIDVQRIYREAEASKAFRARLDELRTREEEQFRARENALVEADRELVRQRSELSPEAFTLRGQELTNMDQALQQDIQSYNEALKDQLARGINEVQNALIAVVQEIAAERDLDLVITAGSVVLQNPVLDITEDAMARLNARLPDVSLKTP